MVWEFLIPIGAGLLRNVAGWLENSFKDGKVNAYEWGQLGKTILEIFVIAIAAYYGLGTDMVASSALGVLASVGISTVRKIGV